MENMSEDSVYLAIKAINDAYNNCNDEDTKLGYMRAFNKYVKMLYRIAKPRDFASYMDSLEIKRIIVREEDDYGYPM